jgi:hypothetical protein
MPLPLRRAGQQLQEHDAQREQIGAGVDVIRSLQLLGSPVERRPDVHPALLLF